MGLSRFGWYCLSFAVASFICSLLAFLVTVHMRVGSQMHPSWEVLASFCLLRIQDFCVTQRKQGKPFVLPGEESSSLASARERESTLFTLMARAIKLAHALTCEISEAHASLVHACYP